MLLCKVHPFQQRSRKTATPQFSSTVPNRSNKRVIRTAKCEGLWTNGTNEQHRALLCSFALFPRFRCNWNKRTCLFLLVLLFLLLRISKSLFLYFCTWLVVLLSVPLYFHSYLWCILMQSTQSTSMIAFSITWKVRCTRSIPPSIQIVYHQTIKP